MTLDDYQAEAARTAPRSLEAYPLEVRMANSTLIAGSFPLTAESLLKTHDVLIWALGLAGEAGEVCDLLKKVHGHGKPYEPEKLKKELGDVLWYVANLASAHGFSLGDAAQANVDKLRARYPTGFSVAAAAAKADEQEVTQPGAPPFKLVEKIIFGAASVDANGFPAPACPRCYADGFDPCACDLEGDVLG